MVLLIPEAVKKIRLKERKEHNARIEQAYEQFGVEVDGKLVLTITPEVDRMLKRETSTESDED